MSTEMKQLELELKKRLLIVEIEKEELVASMLVNDFFPNLKLEIICEGSELTEEIADELVDIFDLGYFVDYNHHNPRSYKFTALESFISAIEAKQDEVGIKIDLSKSLIFEIL